MYNQNKAFVSLEKCVRNITNIDFISSAILVSNSSTRLINIVIKNKDLNFLLKKNSYSFKFSILVCINGQLGIDTSDTEECYKLMYIYRIFILILEKYFNFTMFCNFKEDGVRTTFKDETNKLFFCNDSSKFFCSILSFAFNKDSLSLF